MATILRNAPLTIGPPESHNGFSVRARSGADIDTDQIDNHQRRRA